MSTPINSPFNLSTQEGFMQEVSRQRAALESLDSRKPPVGITKRFAKLTKQRKDLQERLRLTEYHLQAALLFVNTPTRVSFKKLDFMKDVPDDYDTMNVAEIIRNEVRDREV